MKFLFFNEISFLQSTKKHLQKSKNKIKHLVYNVNSRWRWSYFRRIHKQQNTKTRKYKLRSVTCLGFDTFLWSRSWLCRLPFVLASNFQLNCPKRRSNLSPPFLKLKLKIMIKVINVKICNWENYFRQGKLNQRITVTSVHEQLQNHQFKTPPFCIQLPLC